MLEEQFKDISYKITGAIYEVARNMGPGLLEKCYEKALAYELKQRGLNPECQKEIRVLYKGIDMDLQYFADIVADGRAIIELKAVSELSDVHRAQLMNYLRLTGIEFGVLVNFGKPKADIERFVVHRSPDFNRGETRTDDDEED